jgi:outer membrane lipoprotein-sorting protein
LAPKARIRLLLLILLLMSGCAMTPERLVKNAAGKNANLKSYYAEVEAVVFSPEGEQRYLVRQWVQAPVQWRVEVDSDCRQQVFLCDGSYIFVYQPGTAEYFRFGAVRAGEAPPPFLLLAYLEELLRARSISLEGRQKAAGTTAYAVSFGSDRPDEVIKVFLDTRRLFPVMVETYQNEEILNRITCRQLELNPTLDANLFIFTPPSEDEVAAHCLTVPITLEDAKNNWALPLYVPQYLPPGARLFSVTLTEEDGRQYLIQIYDGQNSFTLVQKEKGEGPALTPGLEEATVGEHRGLFRRNLSGGVNALYWSNETSEFVLTGTISLPEMLKVAESLRSD